MKKNTRVWLFLLVITFLLRFYSFLFSVIDWDESLYLLIAEAWSHGSIPYVEIWDQKPPGIYACYLVAKLMGFGDMLVGIRIMSVLMVSASAFLLYKIAEMMLPSAGWFSIAPALLYITFSLNNQGLAANTEIFFIPFVLGGFYFVLRCIDSEWQFREQVHALVLSGLLVGIAFQIKYLVAFDLIALATGIVLLQWYHKKNKAILSVVKIGALIFAGFLIPNIAVALYFSYHGHLQDLLNATLSANVQHQTHGDFSLVKTAGKFYLQFRDQILLWGSVVVACWWLVRGKLQDDKKMIVLFLLGWLMLTVISASLTRKFYPHYFLQALPPLCLFFFLIFNQFLEAAQYQTKRIIYSLLILFVGVATVLPVVEDTLLTVYFRKVAGNSYWGDSSAEIADYIKNDLTANDYIFVAGGQPIIYYLSKAKIPTRFPYPPFFLDDHFRFVSGIDQEEEIKSILAKQPKFIITRKLDDNVFYQSLEPYLLQDYSEVHEIDGKSIFLRKE